MVSYPTLGNKLLVFPFPSPTGTRAENKGTRQEDSSRKSCCESRGILLGLWMAKAAAVSFCTPRMGSGRRRQLGTGGFESGEVCYNHPLLPEKARAEPRLGLTVTKFQSRMDSALSPGYVVPASSSTCVLANQITSNESYMKPLWDFCCFILILQRLLIWFTDSD